MKEYKLVKIRRSTEIRGDMNCAVSCPRSLVDGSDLDGDFK